MFDDDKFGSQHSVGEKLEAEIEDETPESYFVCYGGNEYDIEPKTEKNRLLFETDLITEGDPTLVAAGTARFGEGEGIYVEFVADFPTDEYTLTVEEAELVLSGQQAFDVLADVIEDVTSDDEAFEPGPVRGMTYPPSNVTSVEESDDTHDATPVDAEQLSDATARTLYRTFNEIRSKRVREPVVAEFADRHTGVATEGSFMTGTESRVDIRDEGWVIDETFLVTFEAENYVVDDITTHEVEGGTVVEADERHQFLEVSFDAKSEAVVEAPSGVDVDLSEREQEFLATVEVLCYPGDYLGTDLVHKVEQAVEDTVEPIADVADTADVQSYMDHKTGLVHDHELDKHTLRATFNVTREVIDELYFNEHDHAGVHELVYREEEFRDADFDVFYDTDNCNDARWQRIDETTSTAYVPDSVHLELRARYGS